MSIVSPLLAWHWEWAWAAWLLPLPVLMLLFRNSKQQAGALQVPFWEQLQSSGTGRAVVLSSRWIRWLWLWVLWALIVLALMRPISIDNPIELPREGRSLLLAVDISGSMKKRDMSVNGKRVDRLSAVKHVLKDFLQRRQGDKVGLLLFGSQAFVQAPLTFDIKTLERFLDETVVGLAGEKTAIGDAIGLAIKQVDKIEAGDRVLILLTDGNNTAGEVSPEQSALYAQQEGLKIYTIAFGRDRRGRVFQPALLKQIAVQTGGQNFVAAQTQQLEAIYDQIDKLEPIDDEQAFFRPRVERYFEIVQWAIWWAILGMALQVISVLWGRLRAS